MKTKLHEALAALTKQQLGFDPIQLEKEDARHQNRRVWTQVMYLLFLLLSLFLLLIGCIGLIRTNQNQASWIPIVIGTIGLYITVRIIGNMEISLGGVQLNKLSQWRKIQTLMHDVSGLFEDCDNTENLKVQIDSMIRFIVSELKETPRVHLILTTSNPRLEQKRFNLDTLLRIVIELKLFGSDKLDYERSAHTDAVERQKQDEETLICLITKRILDNPVAPLA